MTTLRQRRVWDASNCGNFADTCSNLFLTDGVVTPFGFSRVSPCMYTDSEVALPWCRCDSAKNCSQLDRVMSAHQMCTFTMRIIVTQGNKVVPVYHDPRVQPILMEQNWVAHTRLESNCLQREGVLSFPCCCGVSCAVHGSLQTLECGGSFTSGGGSTCRAGNISLHKCTFFHVDEAELQRTVVSRYLLGHRFQNQEIDRLKRWSGSEEVRALLLRCVFHLFHRQLAMNVQRAFVSFVLCPSISSCSLCGNHTHDNPKTTIHLHLTITSQLFQTCFCDQLWNQETSLNVVDAGLFLLQLISFTLSQRLSNRDHKFFAHCSKHFHVCERHLPALPSWTLVVVSTLESGLPLLSWIHLDGTPSCLELVATNLLS